MSTFYAGTGVGGGSSIGQANTANALGTTSIGSGSAINAIQSQQEALYQEYLLRQQYQQQQQKMPSVLAQPFDKDEAAWEASISTLVDVWLAKYGDKWVNEDELTHDKFFAIAATRLLKLNRLEKINVPTSMHAVYRIVE
jgi:hypothetical protein